MINHIGPVFVKKNSLSDNLLSPLALCAPKPRPIVKSWPEPMDGNSLLKTLDILC